MKDAKYTAILEEMAAEVSRGLVYVNTVYNISLNKVISFKHTTIEDYR